MKALFILCIAMPIFAQAYGSRYTVTGNCYHINNQAPVVSFQTVYTNQTGESDYSCQNAFDSLKRLCNEFAIAQGFSNGEVYRSIQITASSFSKENQYSSSSSDTRKGPWGIAGSKHDRNQSSASKVFQESEFTYQEVDPSIGKGCFLDASVRQAARPDQQSYQVGK